MKLDRDFYRPKESDFRRDIKREDYLDLEIYTFESGPENAPHFDLVVFGGKRSKPDANYYYKTEEARGEAVARWKENAERNAKAKADRKAAARKLDHGLKVGDILNNSWGYDQTNVDFFEVVRVTKRCVWIRQLTSSIAETTEWMQGTRVPNPGSYDKHYTEEWGEGGKKCVVNVSEKFGPSVNALGYRKFGWARPWDGTPQAFSSYA